MKQGEVLCESCTLKEYTYVKPYFTPSKQLPILFVGQAAGQIETITGIPFTGPAGKMLWRVMHEAGINKLKVDVTNAAKCAPPDDRKPTKLELGLCKVFLREDILKSQPKLIVALGDVACKVLVGKAKIQSLRGTLEPLLPWFDYDCEVLCALHPSFVMRQRQWIPIAVQDMLKAKQYVTRGKVEVAGENCKFETDFDEYQLEKYLEEASKHVTAFDTETTGLNPRKDRIVGASVCFDEDVAVAFDLNAGDPKWQPLIKWLEDENAKKVMQNGQFDCAMLDGHGVTAKGLCFDTRLAEHLISSDLPGSLDFLRSKYTAVKPYKPTKKEIKEIAHWTRDKRLSYGCKDALVTWLVYKAQLEELEPGNLRVLREIEVPLIEVVNLMEKKGVMVDTDALNALKAELEPKVERFKTVYFDPIGVNPNSPKQLCDLFGVTSTGEEYLRGCIKARNPHRELMQVLLDYRAAQKVLSVYVDGVLDKMEFGRIHTHYKIGGAGTGRLSSIDPNLHNVPKDLRGIYVSDPDCGFIEADYSQLEIHVLAVVAEERTMLSEIENGRNVHHEACKMIFDKSWEDASEKEKVWTKNVVFGTAYGRGPTAIARQFGVTIKDAEEWQSRCIKKYPGLVRYRNRQESVFTETGKSYTAFGRSRPIQTMTQALNTPIQSPGSDICLTSLILLHRAKFDLRLTVHDSITVQADKEVATDVANEMKRIMTRPIEEMNRHSFPVSMKWGLNWKDLHPFNTWVNVKAEAKAGI